MSEPRNRSCPSARLFLLLVLASLGGCVGSGSLRAAGREGDAAGDVYPEPPFLHPTCDFGVLRGTKSMRCSDEFKRKDWFLWT